MKSRILLLAHTAGNEETPPAAPLACAGIAARIERDPALSRRISLTFEVVELGPAVSSRSARRLGRSKAGPSPSVIVVASESWSGDAFPGFVHGLREKAPGAVLGLFSPTLQHEPGPAFERLPEVDLLFHAPPETAVPSWLSHFTGPRAGGRAPRGVIHRGDPARSAPVSRADETASWRSPFTARTASVLRGAALPFILEHYREREPLLAGAPEAYERQFDLAPSSRIRGDLQIAGAAGASSIALRGPVINPAVAHTGTLSRAFDRSAGGATIPYARWLPQGPCSREIVGLLQRVRRLEVDYPSSSPEAGRFFRPGCGHDAVASALAWLRAHSIEPTICVWGGVPGDDEETLLETLRHVYSLRPSRVNIRGMVAPPGSFLSRHRERFGLVIDPVPPHYVLGHEGADPFRCRSILEICRRSVGGYGLWTRHALAASAARP